MPEESIHRSNPPDLTRLRCVLFDFSKTLCSEPYFAPLGTDALQAIGKSLFAENSASWADPSMRGELTKHDIAAYLSELLPHTTTELLDALHRGCAKMAFNEGVWQLVCEARQAGLKTALVTLNMDVFTEVVVPSHGLDSIFDAIVNSADVGMLDKNALCSEALQRLGEGHDFSSSLLIDDNPRFVSAFRCAGG